MKIFAIVALCTGIAAAAAAIVLQSVRIHKAGKSDKYTTRTILFAAVFIVIAVVNLILVVPNL